MSNIVIIGSGPAGVSAALYAARAGVQTTVLTKGPGALDRAELIQNYYGFAEPIAGAELERRGIEGAKAVGVEFVTTEAVGLTYTDKLTVETLAGDFPADAVILATGASRAAPRIPGLAGLEGHGVSWCAVCDAFFYRGKDVAVLGSGAYALHEVQALLPVVKSVSLLTNGMPLTETGFEEWRRILSINLDGAFLGLRTSLRAMKAGGQGKSVVLTASAVALKPVPNTAAYGTSKAAVAHLARVAAAEHLADGIRVNAVAPGRVDTPIWTKTDNFKAMAEKLGSREAALEAIGNATGVESQFTSVEVMARQIGWLLSDEAENITGVVLASDGGYTL